MKSAISTNMKERLFIRSIVSLTIFLYTTIQKTMAECVQKIKKYPAGFKKARLTPVQDNMEKSRDIPRIPQRLHLKNCKGALHAPPLKMGTIKRFPINGEQVSRYISPRDSNPQSALPIKSQHTLLSNKTAMASENTIISWCRDLSLPFTLLI